MSSYTAHNSKAFGNGVKQYTERVIKAKLVAMLKTVAQAIVGIIDTLEVDRELEQLSKKQVK